MEATILRESTFIYFIIAMLCDEWGSKEVI